MGTNINEDGTKGFVNTAIRGGDLALIAAWHGANDPTAANNKIPANGLFLNTTERVIKLNIGTEAAPIWKPYYQFPVYGRSSQSITIDANTSDGVAECNDLTINDGITLSGKQKQNLIIVCKKLILNGTISMTGLGADGTIDNSANPENSKNLDSHAGRTIRTDGTIIAGGIADVYRKPNLTEMQIGYGAAAPSISNINLDLVTKGGGRIIIIAREIEFGANGRIEASGNNGRGYTTTSGSGGGAGGDINIITATALTADQKAKIVYSDIAAERNGTDGAAGVKGVGGKARLTEIII